MSDEDKKQALPDLENVAHIVKASYVGADGVRVPLDLPVPTITLIQPSKAVKADHHEPGELQA